MANFSYGLGIPSKLSSIFYRKITDHLYRPLLFLFDVPLILYISVLGRYDSPTALPITSIYNVPAAMKLHENKTANRRMSKYGIAALCLFKIERIHSFDVGCSMFDVHWFLFRFIFATIECGSGFQPRLTRSGIYI